MSYPHDERPKDVYAEKSNQKIRDKGGVCFQINNF